MTEDDDHLASLEFGMYEGSGRRRLGRRHGPWTLCDSTGQVRVEGHFERGREHGLFRYRDADGSLIREICWERGVERSSTVWEGGRIVRRSSTLRNGSQLIEHYRPCGTLRERSTWNGSVLTREEFYETGARYEQHQHDSSAWVGTHRWWTIDGRHRSARSWDGTSSAPAICHSTWDEYGSVRVSYVAGKQHGESVDIDHAGHEWRTSTYVEGRRHGPARCTSVDGSRATFAYRDDQLVGRARTTYPTGRRRWHASFRAGELHGPCTAWHASGELDRTGSFESGTMHGRWLYYATDGTLIADLEFIAGQLQLPCTVVVEGRPRRLQRRETAESILRIEPATGALHVDEHGAVRALRDVCLRRFVGREHRRLQTTLWPNEAPSSEQDAIRRIVSEYTDSCGVAWRSVRNVDGRVRIQRRAANSGRWRTAVAIGTARAPAPGVISLLPSPDRLHAAVVFDADGSEGEFVLQVVRMDDRTVRFSATIPRVWDPDGPPCSWSSTAELIHPMATSDGTALGSWSEAEGARRWSGSPEGTLTQIVFGSTDHYEPGSVALAWFDHDASEGLSTWMLDLDATTSARTHLPRSSWSFSIDETAWPTIVVGHRSVIVRPPSGSDPPGPWQLLRTCGDTGLIESTTYDGSTLVTTEAHHGRPVVRKATKEGVEIDQVGTVAQLGGRPARAVARDGTRLAMTVMRPLAETKVRGVVVSMYLMGSSHGGWTATMAAHRAPAEVAGVVASVPLLDLSDSTHVRPLAPWRLQAPGEMDLVRDVSPYHCMPAEVPFDLFVAVGTADSRVAWHDGARYALRARSRQSGDAFTCLWIEEGAGHRLDPRRADARTDAVVAFLDRSATRHEAAARC